ncbi:MAG TPA: adenylate/guanylate cyclase domain-containing protein [Candidatus Binataceae bacterium]
MRCTKCGTDNAADARFCNQCATSLGRACPKCAHLNAPGAKFCSQCATALDGQAGFGSKTSASPIAQGGVRVAAEDSDAPVPGDGERKTVTALFADIKGSTEMMEDLDPERARAIIDPALTLMMDAVHRYDGYVVQSTGDGIFALFGAPLAHEDHPQRALYAALRMQEELRRYSAKVVADGGTPIQCRIGINTGEVVVRSIQTGVGHVEYTPIGHTTNLASRMQTAAPVGSIAVTEATRKLCEGYFILKPLGATKVKGVSEPVNVYEVTGLGPLRTRLQRSAGRGYTKFVGRNREMDAMKAAAEQAKAGHGQIVAAMAEPGVGKSRLLFEFKAVSQSGWMVLETFSVSHGKASAYLPVIDLLHGYFRINADDEPRIRREKVTGRVLALDRALEDTLPYLFALLGVEETVGGLAQMDAQVRQRRTLDAIKRVLLRESLNQPLIIVFEDLHWIDTETQALLNLLADSIGTARILLLVNYRPEYSHQWNSKTYYTQLRLDPLGKESAEELLSSKLGAGKDLIPLKRLIIEKTEGNPFFMEEMVQVLFDEGTLVRNGSVKVTKSLSQLRIPSTVQAILASRIDRLPPDEKDLLHTLAVIGREFSLGLVKAVSGKSEDELQLILSDLQLAEFIYEQPAAGDVEYTFKHALTQEVAYGSVLIERRKALHGRAAAGIEELYGDLSERRYDDLAHHYVRSGNALKAAHYLRMAGIAGFDRGGYTQSLERLSTGLELVRTLPNGPDTANLELDLQLSLVAPLQAVRGQAAEEVGRVLERARALIPRSGRIHDLARLLDGLANYHVFIGSTRRARELADEALSLARQTNEPQLLSNAHSRVAFIGFYLGEFSSSLEHAEEARELAALRPEAWARFRHVQALWQSGRCLWFLGFHDRALARWRDSLTAAQRDFNPVNLAITTGAFADLYGYGGELRAMKEQLEAHLATNDQYGLAAVIPGREKILDGWCRVAQGEAQGGIAMIRQGIELNSINHYRVNSAFYASLLAKASALTGRMPEGLQILDQALSQVEQSGECFFEAELFRLKGEFLNSSNADLSSVETCFRRAIEVARAQRAKRLELRTTTSLARLLDRQGKRDEARAMISEIHNRFTEGFDTADLKDAKALLDQLSGS